jgi:signal transduction histidine kinase
MKKLNLHQVAQTLGHGFIRFQGEETEPAVLGHSDIETALHHLPVPLLIFNEREDILFANEALHGLLDLPLEEQQACESLGQWPFYLNPLRSRLRDYLSATHQHPQDAPPLERQTTSLCLAGIERNIGFSLRTEVLRHNGQNTVFWIMVASDITGQTQAKAIEDGLRRARYQALHTGSIARQLHAFSACLFPALFAISQQASLIEQESRHERIHRASQHIQASVGEVQELFGMLEALYSPPVMHTRKMQLQAMVREWLRELERDGFFPERVKVLLDEPTEQQHVLLDARLMKQVLRSVLKNAVEAFAQLSHQALYVQREFTIRLSFSQENCDGLGHMVKLHIEDNGPGMPPNAMEQAFDPFFTTKAEQPLGIGLARAFHILEAHHGYITLEHPEAVGAGVHVCIYLPEAP